MIIVTEINVLFVDRHKKEIKPCLDEKFCENIDSLDHTPI